MSYGSNGLAFGITAGDNYGKGYEGENTYASSHIGDKPFTLSLLFYKFSTAPNDFFPIYRHNERNLMKIKDKQ